ncbi:MoxR family ATPase [Comamonas sp. Z1]|uniref:AAA family ATPase n=1 Tax=Comamonas sp. Z1 TaxID=2601246 RepID=UPI0006B8BD2F|nr:MoxR family ATPase [Comamonas sp. Z1]
MASAAFTLESPLQIQQALDQAGYITAQPLASVLYLAMALNRPLFLEGEPGVGKTALANAIASATGATLFRLQCHEGLDATHALYDWDFRKQMLHLRVNAHEGADTESLESGLYSRRFLLARPVMQALQTSPSVLLIDEIDRADDEFEALLLEALSTHSITIPEIGTIRAETPPLVILTSNRTREVHDALKRRCLYHWLEHPSADTELAILRRQLPQLSLEFSQEIVATVQALRSQHLLKPPGIAESLDWAGALLALRANNLADPVAALALGALVKHSEDMAKAVFPA